MKLNTSFWIWFGWNSANIIYYLIHFKSGEQITLELIITTIVLLIILKIKDDI